MVSTLKCNLSRCSLKPCRPWLVGCLLGVMALPAIADKQVYYRYINEKGVQVLNHSIPPEYAQKGYEIVRVSGEVIKTVEPMADADARARKEAEAAIHKEYRRLERRYSSLKEIEAAKQRRLDTLDSNIAILRANITSLEVQIETLVEQAADVERSGREVPEAHLRKLTDTRAELATTKDVLGLRLGEYQKTADKFDQDKALYTKGKELARKR